MKKLLLITLFTGSLFADVYIKQSKEDFKKYMLEQVKKNGNIVEIKVQQLSKKYSIIYFTYDNDVTLEVIEDFNLYSGARTILDDKNLQNYLKIESR